MERPESQEVDRQQIDAVTASLRRTMESRLASGLLPYGGRWLPLPTVQEEIARERRRARVHAFELVAVFCLNSIASLVIIEVVWQLCR